MKKIALVVICLLCVFTIFGDNLHASGLLNLNENISIEDPERVPVDPKIASTSHNVWQTVWVIVRVLAVLAVAFAGLRYMFASADQKADIKTGLIYISIGALLVFGATLIIDFVVKVANETI